MKHFLYTTQRYKFVTVKLFISEKCDVPDGMRLRDLSYCTPPFYQLRYTPPFYQLRCMPSFYQLRYMPPFYQLRCMPPFYQLRCTAPFYQLRWRRSPQTQLAEVVMKVPITLGRGSRIIRITYRYASGMGKLFSFSYINGWIWCTNGSYI